MPRCLGLKRLGHIVSPASLYCILVGITIYLMDDLATQLRKGSLELAVLALLRTAPRYGVEIVDELAARPGLEATSGTIYPLLTRLKNQHLVETTWQESPVGPPRKYYRLTPGGRSQLVVQAAAWRRLSVAINELLKEVEQ